MAYLSEEMKKFTQIVTESSSSGGSAPVKDNDKRRFLITHSGDEMVAPNIEAVKEYRQAVKDKDWDKVQKFEEEWEPYTRVSESWDKKMNTPASKKGMFKGKTKAELRSELSSKKAQSKKLHDAGKKEPESLKTKIKELEFALRAKNKFGKVNESEDCDCDCDNCTDKNCKCKCHKKVDESALDASLEELRNLLRENKDCNCKTCKDKTCKCKCHKKNIKK